MMKKIDSPFETLTVMDYFEELSEREQYIVGWKTGMFGPNKTSKALAKELSTTIEDIDTIYLKSINYIKTSLLE